MTSLDYILVAALVFAIPAEALWRSVRGRGRPRPPLGAILRRTIQLIVVLVALLALIWAREERSLALLGLEAPLSTGGFIGLAIAVALVGLLGIASVTKKSATDAREKAEAAGMLPQTPGDRRLFAIFSFTAGIGWELLYRGYLLWALSPVIGVVAAVVVASIAYGLGHGLRSARGLIGAVFASFLFTIGYALTGSLWWVMVLHVGLPLIGIAATRAPRAVRT